MPYAYSPTTRGFYVPDLGTMPGDAVPITDALHAQLLAAQESGQEIVPGPGGAPMAQAPVVPTLRLAAAARARRDALLAASDFTQLGDTPLTTAQRTAWQGYRTALRDMPQQAGFPATVTWPTPPA